MVLVAGWRVTRHWYGSRESRSWAGPPAVALAFAAAWLALFGWTGLPPHDAIDWLLPLTLPLMLLGLLESYYRWPLPAGVLAIAVAVAITLLAISWPRLGAAADDGFSTRLFAVTTLAMLTLIPLDRLAQRLTFGRMSAILFAVGAPAAVTLGCSGSARLGLIATVLAATQAGGVAAGIVLGRSATARGVVLVFGSLLAGILWSGYAYASLSVVDGLLLTAAPQRGVARTLGSAAVWLVDQLRLAGRSRACGGDDRRGAGVASRVGLVLSKRASPLGRPSSRKMGKLGCPVIGTTGHLGVRLTPCLFERYFSKAAVHCALNWLPDCASFAQACAGFARDLCT